MGCGAIGTVPMNRVWSYATRVLARLLDPQEREVALGDVAELGFAGRRAFAGMLGLVVRRQLQSWKDPRPWFVLLALVFPMAILLAYFLNRLGMQLFPVVMMWSHHHVAYSTGVTPVAEVCGWFLEVAAIMLGSWSLGFAVAKISRATRHVAGLLFCILLIVGMGMPLAPFSLIVFCCTGWGLIPVIIAVLICGTPASCGLSRGASGSTIQVQGLIFLAIGTGIVGVLTAWVQGWYAAAMENWSHAGSPLTLVQLLKSEVAWGTVTGYLFAIFVMASPALYLLANRTLYRNNKTAHMG